MQPTTTTQRPREDAATSTTEATKAPVKVIREGAIAASVWERQGVNGTFYEYRRAAIRTTSRPAMPSSWGR